MNTKLILAAPCLAMLAACGGGSTGVANYASLAAEGQFLINKYQAEQVTPVSNMPVGVATYNGVGAFSDTTSNLDAIVANPALLGDVEIQVNFDTNTLTGTIDDFVDYNGDEAAGSISITSGSVSGNTFNASLSGSGTLYGQSAAVVAQTNGVFLGADGGGMLGDVSGYAAGAPFYGVIGAEK